MRRFLFILSFFIMCFAHVAAEDAVHTNVISRKEKTTSANDSKKIQELKKENELLKIRSNINTLSSGIILSVVMIFFMWGIKERNRKHMLLLERKNYALLRANEKAEEAREFAERQSELKTIFINNLSHEVRTPLNQIYGFTQLMSSEDLLLPESELREMAGHVCEASEHLTLVLDNLNEVTEKLGKMTKLQEVESVLKV